MFFIGTLRSLLPIAVVLSALLLINKFLKAEETLLVILSINPDDFISFIGTDICCLFPRTFIIPLTNLGVTNPNFIASIPKRIDAASLRFNCSISLNVKLPASFTYFLSSGVKLNLATDPSLPNENCGKADSSRNLSSMASRFSARASSARFFKSSSVSFSRVSTTVVSSSMFLCILMISYSFFDIKSSFRNFFKFALIVFLGFILFSIRSFTSSAIFCS